MLAHCSIVIICPLKVHAETIVFIIMYVLHCPPSQYGVLDS